MIAIRPGADSRKGSRSGKESGAGASIALAARLRKLAATRAPALALALILMPPVLGALDMIAAMVTSPVSAGSFGLVSFARGQPAALTLAQAEALNAYNNALTQFKAILSQRRAEVNSHQRLPNLLGQALYLAHNSMISTYKDLTDVLPSKIGRPNKFRIPPAYFNADNEPLLDEYTAIFNVMQAPPANAQNSETPFKDIVDVATS